MTTTYGDRARYRYVKLSQTSARTTKFKNKDGAMQTVEQYFKDKYNTNLLFPNLPLVHMGSVAKPIYIPIELLKVSDKWQRLRMKLPDDIQVS